MEGIQLSLFPEEYENSDNFFTRKRHWSAAKHRILLKYIQAHCYNLGGDEPYQSRYINYVDGFAGTGRYEKGIGIEDFVNNSNFWAKKYNHDFQNTDGSPLLALKCAKLFRQEGRVNLRCFFIEYNRNYNKQLKENCDLVSQDLIYKISQPQKFEVAFPEVMSDLHNYPTLFFLDTFAVKGFTFEHICSIGKYVSRYKGELFLLFNNISVARHAGHYKEVYDNSKEQKTSETYMSNLTKLLGINSDKEWKPMWLKLKSKPQEFERWALEYFKERMRKEAGFKGVTSFEIKETYSDSRPKYSIVVGSNHPQKAFGVFLNDFVWEEERLLFFKDNNQGITNFLEKEWNSENEKRILKIKVKAIEILSQFKSNWISFEDAITYIILGIRDLGCLKRTQYYNDILKPLYDAGKIEIKNPGVKKAFTLKSLMKLK